MNYDELTALFARLGAQNPAAWARSQIEEGTPQLARFLFLREAWKRVVPEDDVAWITRELQHAQHDPNGPFAGVGHALRTLKAAGVADQVLTDLVRGMQASLLSSLCSLLDDPGVLEPEVCDVVWSLVQIDDEGNVLGSVSGLHESVLETDPSGRELRPRPQ